MTRVTIIAEGWIQHVNYRVFVKHIGSQLGLKGLVRNISDGRVEVFCEGRLQRIDKLLKMMNYQGAKNDPLSAHVESLKIYKRERKNIADLGKNIRDLTLTTSLKSNRPWTERSLKSWKPEPFTFLL